MARELELPPAPILDPVTGTLIDRDDLLSLVEAVERLKEAKDQLTDALGHITDVIAEHSRSLGTKTIHLDTCTLELSPDHSVQWDVETLAKLNDVGLPENRWSDLVTPTVEWKVNASVAKQLASANPDYALIIEKAQTRIPKRQYVKVRR